MGEGERQADSKGGKSPEMWHLEDRLQDEDAHGMGQELGGEQPPRLKESKLPGCAALCPPLLSWPLSSGVLRQRPFVHTWVELEAGAARSVVTGCSLWAALNPGCSHLSLLPQSWRLNISLEPSTALSLRPHRAE